MNEFEIQKNNCDMIIKKSDVWLFYTKTNKCWVCKIDGIKLQGDYYILTLATKGKSDK